MWQKQLIPIALMFASQLTVAAQGGGARYAKWGMEDKFDNGLHSWQSYPLAQDIGYDPSLYTIRVAGKAVLRRDVVSEGQNTQEVGLLRPLRFPLTASTRIAVMYSLELSGQAVNAKIILASHDGTKYEVPLSLGLNSQVTRFVNGSQLHLAGRQAEIDAVALLFAVRDVPIGSHILLTLHSFSVDAMTSATFAMISPNTFASSSGEIPVVNGFVRTGSPAAFSFTSPPRQVILEDGYGNTVHAATVIRNQRMWWTPEKNSSPGLWTMKVTNGQSTLAFRVLVLRDELESSGIILQQQRLTELRTAERFLDLRHAIHTEALKRAQDLSFNPKAGDSIALLPSNSVFAGLPAYADLMDKYAKAAAYNALDFKLNGDQQALKITCKVLLTVSAWRTWTPPWFAAHGMHTYYVVGVFTESLALAYDLVSDHLTSGERQAIENATMRNSIQPTIDDYYLEQRMPTGASNHMAHSVGGALAAWTAFDRVDPNWRVENGASLAELIAGYEDLLNGLFPGDGSEAEPVRYELFAMEGMTYGISSLASLGIIPKGYQKMMDSFWWLRYAEVSPNLVLDTGDTVSTLSALSGYAWLTEHSADPGARWLYDTVQRPLLDVPLSRESSSVRLPSPITPQVPNVLDLLCCTKPAADFSAAAPSRIFEGRGSIALRDSWNNAQMAISIRVGPWFNHEHHDQGSFQVAVYGQLLVTEGGYTDYYKDPNYKTYFSEAPAHNVVLLDHGAYSQVPYDGRYWKALASYPKVISAFLGDGIDYLEADLKPAYGEALEEYTRKFLYLKPALLVVSDHLAAPKDHVFDWLLHLAPAATIHEQASKLVVVDPGKQSSLTVMASDPSLSWHIAETPIAVSEFLNLDEEHVHSRRVLSLDSNSTARHNFIVGLSASAAQQVSGLARIETHSGQGILRTDTDQEALALVRDKGGLLEIWGASTDGDALAIIKYKQSDSVHFFVNHARSLRIADHRNVSLSAAGNLAWDQTGQSVTLGVELARPSRILLNAPFRRGSLKLDDRNEPTFAAGQSFPIMAGRHTLKFLLNAPESAVVQDFSGSPLQAAGAPASSRKRSEP